MALSGTERPAQDGDPPRRRTGGRRSAALMIAACGAFALARLPARRHLAPAVRPGRDALGPDPPDADRRRVARDARRHGADGRGDHGDSAATPSARPRRSVVPAAPRRCSWAASWSRSRPSRPSSTSAFRSSARCYQPILIMLAAGIGLVTARALPRPRRRAAGRGRLPRDPRLPGADGRRRLGPDDCRTSRSTSSRRCSSRRSSPRAGGRSPGR